MPRIRCLYTDCVFLDDGYCGAAAIQLDPDLGCNSYKRADDFGVDEDWENKEDDLEEWEQLDLEDDELWLEDDDF
ncbi:MAG TPA: hypothetical protein ENI27_09570 [bacterium]|nr:hypothetical protein [bacterium]